MDEDFRKFPLGQETYEIIGCAMEVLNELGHGYLEKPYENAMTVEFRLRGISYVQQRLYRILYKGEVVGDYIPDLIAYNNIVVDLKVIERIGNNEIGQMLNYLKATNLPVGLIINFKRPELEWKRVVR
jgi:GxxExxY protein